MIFLYSVLIVISFAFYILYVGNLSFYLFAFLVLLPVILIIITSVQKRKIKVIFITPHCTTICGKQTPITVKITNNSVFPVENAEITLSYSMHFSNKKEELKINTPVFPKSSQTLTFNINSKHCGIVKLEITKVKIFDILRLFKTKLRPSEIKTQNNNLVTVLPELLYLNNEIISYSYDNSDDNVYSKTKKGDDPSEIFDIREYAEGDKLNRIHWNLTAKQGNTMVKDFSFPITNQITLMLNLSFKNTDFYDAVITSAYSIAYFLSEKQITHNICWYNESSQENTYVSAENADDISQIIYEILGTPIHQDDCAIFSKLNNLPKSAHWIFITSTLSDKLIEILESINQTPLITVVYVNSQPVHFNLQNQNHIKLISVKPQSLFSDLNKIIL